MKHKQRLRQSVAMWMMASWLMIPLPLQAAGNPVPGNMTLPTGGEFVSGTVSISSDASSDSGKNGVMDIKQNVDNAVIKWNDFSIGANAQVNFSKNGGGAFNTLNYVTGSNMSQIYGKLNAKDGNIYLVNPNGVQIGNSAEINVGSLYVSNANLDTDKLQQWDGNGIVAVKADQQVNNAELMSLGYIDAKNVTFDGNRIVLDVDRLNQKTNGDYNVTIQQINTEHDFNLVLGTKDASQSLTGQIQISHDGQVDQNIQEHTYQWIHNADELGNIDLQKNYALRNAIDVTGKSFTSIGSEKNAFTGKLDGLGNNIFGLTGSQGLFGVTDGAKIGHFNLIAGTTGVSIDGTGKEYTGALIGYAKNTRVEDVTNTLEVTGTKQVGGLVGKAENSTFYNVINTGHITGHEKVGGLIGSMSGGTLGQGEDTSDAVNVSHNMGKVEGINDETHLKTDTPEDYYSHHIGGLVGYASDAVIGNANGSVISNLTHVEGGYDVGGIVGRAQDTHLYNLSNEGDILANGYKLGDYIFHTDYEQNGYRGNDGYHTEKVRTANVGGIVGSISVSNKGDNPEIGNESENIKHSRIENVTNSGDVTTTTEKYTGTAADVNRLRYTAGNVGGIVGRARNTDIDTATNRGNHVYGSHNVGGIAGFFGRDDSNQNAIEKQLYYRIRNAVNDGGDIMGTGAVDKDGMFSKEIIRKDYTTSNAENYITGNIGGIAGMVSGVHLLIANSGNRGNVHSYTHGLIDDAERDAASTTAGTEVPTIAETSNIGGIVGKVDRWRLVSTSTDYANIDKITLSDKLAEIKNNPYTAGITGCYNAGTVAGYTNIGGIVGMSYNNSIASSYNVGNIYTTRISEKDRSPSNIGGIVGDTTEHSAARTILYDVFNTGKIGTEDFTYYGRHVGGIVGRLSGIVEKAYNTGEIYNGSVATGGIAGWWYNGYIKNVFNTGNITVVIKNQGDSNDTSKVGGIVGGVDLAGGNESIVTDAEDKQLSNTKKDGTKINDMMLSYAYNLGTLRSFTTQNKDSKIKNSVGGLIGGVYAYEGTADEQKFSLSNVYTTGNLAAFVWSDDKKAYIPNNNNRWAIVGAWGDSHSKYNKKDNIYAIKTKDTNTGFGTLSDTDGGVRYISFDDQLKSDAYKSQPTDKTITGNGFTFYNDLADIKSHPDSWRIDEGSGLPVLNAFYTDTDKFKTTDGKNLTDLGKTGSVHLTHGTAYNPYLTIVTIDKDKFNGNTLLLDAQNKLEMRDSLAVYGAGLTLNNFSIDCTAQTENHLNLYGGLLYSDGALQLNADKSKTNAIILGKSSSLYGSSVTMNVMNNPLTIFGEVTATGTDESDAKNGNININAGSLESYWKLNTAEKGQSTTIAGGNVMDTNADYTETNSNDPTAAMKDIKTYYSRMTGQAAKDGDLNITTEGSAYLLYGNMKQGKTTVYGDMNITSQTGDVYVDTDLYVGGSIHLQGDHHLILDVTHVGAKENKDAEYNYGTAKSVQQFFKDHQDEGHTISFTKNDGTTSSQAKIALDMWVNGDETDDSIGQFNFDKFDTADTEEAKGSKLQDVLGNYKDSLYYWVKNEYQLKGIQDAATSHTDKNILSYHFALKNNIEASALGDSYKAIGSEENQAFTGIFDGMDNAIIGLKAKGGLFGNLGSREKDTDGNEVVKRASVLNLKIYASEFTGDTVGALASQVEAARISQITGLGNTVKGTENVGGLIGKLNFGSILKDVNDQSTVIAQINDTNIVAGGLVGRNAGGSISNASTNSAVTIDETGNMSTHKNVLYIGGITGINDMVKQEIKWEDEIFTYYAYGEIENTSAHGVTGRKSQDSVISGGIAGINNGRITNGYNESVIYGNEGVGGIAGINSYWIENVTNALSINGKTVNKTGKNIGGIVGIQQDNTEIAEGDDRTAHVENGRNTATIYGDVNVGGIVGSNSKNSELHNLENAFMAEINGWKNVGGIAGYNEGRIAADGMELNNSGKIVGNENVGGVAGTNKGIIQNISTDVKLKATGEQAKYFGGTVGFNDIEGIIQDAKNKSIIEAEDADAVGGIVGLNKGTLQGMENTSSGKVIGGSHVGGVIGRNEENIKATRQQKWETRLVEKHYWDIKKDENGEPVLDSNGAFIWEERIEKVNESVPVYKPALDNNGNPIIDADGNPVYTNEPIYEYVNTRITNEGTVIATKGGAGGIIGTNTANLTQVTMTNRGDVHGNGTTAEDGTGGLIGTNSGNIRYSSLINSINGQVTGLSNVGGLIGVNKGHVEGGRAQDTDHDLSKDGSLAVDAGYYTNTVYNNGTIQVGSYNTKDADGNYVLGAANANSQNIGGLIGDNRGTIKAGYNTGVINADNSTNVGGIAGSNSGTIDQVFTNVMTKDGQDQTITGKEHVGGIVGNNANGATISNAYTDKNTTVIGAMSGLIAGNNGGLISNVYGANKNKLIGSGTAVTNGYELSNKANDYNGFDFTNTWKIYEDHTNPLLKVFLTKANVSDDVLNNLTYNGTNQLDVEQIVKNNMTNQKDNTSFAEYNKNKDLIQGSKMKNAGTYANWLWSGQIVKYTDGSSFDPNVLGYDFDVQDKTIAQKRLTVTLRDISRVYGNNIISDNGTYQFDVSGWIAGEENLKDNLSIHVTSDGALKTVNGTADADGKVTSDVGEYGWNGTIQGLGSNYTVDPIADGKSSVTQADLEISLKNISRVYGNLLSQDYNSAWEYKNDTKLVNGDSGLTVSATDDGAIKEGSYTEVQKTQNVGEYTWKGTLGGVANLNKNYKVKVNDQEGLTGSAASKVTQANLVINLNDISRVYGSLDAKDYRNEYTYGDNTSLVNGDTGLIVSATKDEAIADGTLTDVKKTQNVSDSYKWSGGLDGVTNLHTNYKVEVRDGKSAVTKAKLTVGLNEVHRTYGNMNLKDGYSYGVSSVTGNVNGDSYSTADMTVVKDSDTALTGSDAGRVTKNAGNYTWTGKVSSTNALLNQNYEIEAGQGTSVIDKAKLTVGLNEVHRTYGNMNLKDGYSYGASSVTGNVNGDSYSVADMTVVKDSDTALTGSDAGRVTEDAGNYTWTGKVSSTNALLNQNYEIEAGEGTSVIDKAKLNLTVGDVNTTYGTKFDESRYGYTLNGNTNGDSEELVKNLIGKVDYTNNAAKDGTNGTWTDNAGMYVGAVGLGKTKDQINLDNYDVASITNGTATIDKAKLNLTVDDANTTYGTKFDESQYRYTLSGNTNGDSEELVKNLIGEVGYTNSAAKDGTNGMWTDNAGTYGNAVGLGKTKDQINLNNYDVASITNGTATINKAKLNLTVGDANTTYGTKFDESRYGYTLSGNTNGDSKELVKNLIGSVSYTNSAAKDGTNGMWTDNAGTYGSAVGLGKTKEQINLSNYEVESIANGTAKIDKALLRVRTDDQTITVGQKPNYTGRLWGLVNGDSEEVLGQLQYGVADAKYEQTAGTHMGVIRTVNDGMYGELPSAYRKNYDFTHEWGNLIVQQNVRPPIPDVPQVVTDYLWYHTPWDKQHHFRERRAELHFVNGGVHVLAE